MSRAMMGCAPRKEPVMRHDPAGAALIIMLRSLKMPGMAQAVQDLHEQGSPAFEAAMPILSQLLKAEMAEREVRSTAYRGGPIFSTSFMPRSALALVRYYAASFIFGLRLS